MSLRGRLHTQENPIAAEIRARIAADKRYAALWYPKRRTQEVITQLPDDLVRTAEAQLTGELQAATT